MARPAISDERLSVRPDGTIRLKLKTPWRDGTEFLEFTPSEFIEKLIALIPTTASDYPCRDIRSGDRSCYDARPSLLRTRTCRG